MLFQLRGTSGSGKTYIVNRLMSKFEFSEIHKDGKIIGYYCEELNLFLVGSYERTCGGCDTIKTQDEICRRITKGLKREWNVLFEGLLPSHLAERYAKVYRWCEKRDIPVRYYFLDTPVEVCQENVQKRRIRDGKEPRVAKTLESHHHSTFKSRENLIKMGVPEDCLPIMNSKDIYKDMIKRLREEE